MTTRIEPTAPPARSRGPATRKRVLSSAHALIAKHGIRLVKMTDISKHAGVSERTLYNIFRTKNDLVSELVAEYQKDLLRKIRRHELGSLAGITESINEISRDLDANPRWAEAISHLYFQREENPEIHRKLHAISLRHFDMSIEIILKRPDATRCKLHEILRHQFANTGYALLHDLSMGRIDGPELGRQLCVALELGLIALARELHTAEPALIYLTTSNGEQSANTIVADVTP